MTEATNLTRRPSLLMYVPIFGVILEAKERRESGPKIRALFEKVKSHDVRGFKEGGFSQLWTRRNEDDLADLLNYDYQLDVINLYRDLITLALFCSCFVTGFFIAAALAIVVINSIASLAVRNIYSDAQKIQLYFQQRELSITLSRVRYSPKLTEAKVLEHFLDRYS